MQINWYSEMNWQKPAAQIESQLGIYGYWYLSSELLLKSRGIKHLKTYTSSDLVPQAQHKVGWHFYRVTEAAYSQLKKQYVISHECLL